MSSHGTKMSIEFRDMKARAEQAEAERDELRAEVEGQRRLLEECYIIIPFLGASSQGEKKLAQEMYDKLSKWKSQTGGKG